ncbi:ead/Ea22-like family protein [Klebsiella variicola]|uniref:ead/Ea22-like family protein n=1 Tax=Klebsiella variicola TaxID=244366 RepID=UPI00215A5BAE|nr:ead/Ea22-like family protein [Klebsiella variicola]
MTDITELAQSLKATAIDAKELAIIARYSKGRAAAEKFYALANPNNVLALVEALEKAQQRNGELETYSITALEFREAARDENRRLKVDLDIAEKRIAELERQNSVLADGVIRAEQWLLESRTVTDWIEHDGKWRPDSLSTDELVYLKTRKQELKIPYPAGKVMGWMHTGGDMDVMAYKLASPQARTVTVKLPELCVGVVQDGHAVMVPYPAGHWFNKTAILEMLADAGIKVEAE